MLETKVNLKVRERWLAASIYPVSIITYIFKCIIYNYMTLNIVPEIEEAFMLSDDDFASRYGFPKPEKNVSNLVLACKVGIRNFTAYEKLEKMGYKSLK